MSGQQLGRATASSLASRESFPDDDSSSVLSQQIERAGFSEGRSGFSTVRTGRGITGASPKERDAFGFQAGSRLERSPDERALGGPATLSGELGALRTSVAIETMVRQLLARERVLAARKLVAAVPYDHSADETLRRLRVVLAEPVVRRRLPTRTKHSRDIDWLRKNAAKYSGKWVAVADGELLAADESLASLRRNLRKFAPSARPLLHRL